MSVNTKIRRSQIGLIAAVVLSTFALTAAHAAPVTALTFSTHGNEFFSGGNHGWSFTTSQPVNVTALGVWDQLGDGLEDAHEVGIWSAGGALQTSLTIPVGAGGTLVSSGSNNDGFRFVALGSPVFLPAGNYTVAAHYASGLDPVAASVLSGNLTTAPLVAYGGVRQIDGAFAMPTDPNPIDEIGQFGGNFQYSPVPEPSSLALAALSLAGLAAFGRKRKK